MNKIKVAVIFGGVSSEHDISLISAANIIKALQNVKNNIYEIMQIGITKKGAWYLFKGSVDEIKDGSWENNIENKKAILSPDTDHKGFLILNGGNYILKSVDVIFPVLHGKNGEDGTIQGLFKMSGIPFVGCHTLSSAACMDKEFTHIILESNPKIHMAKWKSISKSEIENLDSFCKDAVKELGSPLFVKPANAGSSIGISKAKDEKELVEACQLAFKHDDKVIVEEFIKGRELETAVYGFDKPVVSQVGEILSCNDFYDFDAKYVADSKTVINHDLPAETIEKIRNTAIEAYKTIECKGLSRVDFFLSEDKGVILNEINTLPGFTEISMYPQLMKDSGLDTPELLDKLINDTIDYFKN